MNYKPFFRSFRRQSQEGFMKGHNRHKHSVLSKSIHIAAEICKNPPNPFALAFWYGRRNAFSNISRQCTAQTEMNRNDCSDDFSIMTFMPPSSSTLQGQVIYEGMFIWQVLGTRPVVPNQRSDRLEIANCDQWKSMIIVLIYAMHHTGSQLTRSLRQSKFRSSF